MLERADAALDGPHEIVLPIQQTVHSELCSANSDDHARPEIRARLRERIFQHLLLFRIVDALEQDLNGRKAALLS